MQGTENIFAIHFDEFFWHWGFNLGPVLPR
jgi:hypothetical protein